MLVRPERMQHSTFKNQVSPLAVYHLVVCAFMRGVAYILPGGTSTSHVKRLV